MTFVKENFWYLCVSNLSFLLQNIWNYEQVCCLVSALKSWDDIQSNTVKQIVRYLISISVARYGKL